MPVSPDGKSATEANVWPWAETVNAMSISPMAWRPVARNTYLPAGNVMVWRIDMLHDWLLQPSFCS